MPRSLLRGNSLYRFLNFNQALIYKWQFLLKRFKFFFTFFLSIGFAPSEESPFFYQTTFYSGDQNNDDTGIGKEVTIACVKSPLGGQWNIGDCNAFNKKLRQIGQDAAIGINNLRGASIRGNDHWYPVLNRTKNGGQVVLKGGPCSAKPIVISKLNKQLGSLTNRWSHKVRKKIFPAD